MFESSKVWVLFLVVAILIGLGYGAHYLTSVDEANAANLESKSKLADIQEVLGLRKKVWTATERLINQNREITDQYGILVQAKEALEKRYRAVDSDIKYAVDSMKSSVEKARNTAPGSELGDITLTNGTLLQGAKIRKIEESSISLIHTNGIGTVSLDLLPAELQQRFDMGPNAILPQLEAVQAEFLAKPEKTVGGAAPKTVAVAKPRPAAPEPEAKPTVDEKKVKDIKLKIALLGSRIDSFIVAITRLRETASRHEQLAATAKSSGKPSSRYAADASAVNGQILQTENQISAMREERSKLEVELEFAMRAR